MRLKKEHPHCKNTFFLLRKLVKCGCCNGRMNGQLRIRNNNPSFYIYRCETKQTICDNVKSIDKEKLDNYTLRLVLERCLDSSDEAIIADKSAFEVHNLLKEYVNEVIVYKDYVTFRLKVNGKITEIVHQRSDFATPNQRYFKSMT